MASLVGSEVCLVVLCGLPAVGKSSLARELREAAAGLGWRFAALSYDELIPEEAFLIRHAENDMGELSFFCFPQHTEWKQHRQAVLKSIEHFLQNPNHSELPDVCNIISKASWEKCVQDLLKAPSSQPASPAIFLLDDNFYYPSMRYEVHQLARKYSLGFCQLFLACDLDTCIERNRSRSRPVPSERNAWEKNSIELDTTNRLTANDTQKVVDLISFALKNPLSPIEDDSEQKEADRLRCANSVVHQADQACRKLISEAMKTARDNPVPPSTLRSLASELNERKSKFLQDLKAQLLRDSPFGESENVDVERVVKVFDREKRDILSRTVEENTRVQPR
uniref:Phosphoseryl-tRNA kinase n=1 Tax=Neogobius melanostomus TaxID=47308 RepID=A0A8C6UJ65_9GOBI